MEKELLELIVESAPHLLQARTSKLRFTPLHCAALCGKSSTVTALVNLGSPVESHVLVGPANEFTSETALHLAARACSPEVVQRLVKMGADPNSTTKRGDTPLLLALTYPGDKSMLTPTTHALLRSGARGDRCDNNGDSILHLAFKTGGIAAVKDMVENGASVDCSDSNGDTLVQKFLENGDIDHAVVLIRMGARRVNVSWTRDENTSLFLSALSGDVYGLEKAKVKLQATLKGSSLTLLHLAIVMGHTNVVRHLVKIGDSVHKDGRVFQLAIQTNNKQLVTELIELGGGPKSDQLANSAPLHAAVHTGNMEMLKHLVELGLDTHLTNAEGDTPLFTAAFKNKPEAIKLLLDLGIDINKPNHYGETALVEALKYGNSDAAMELLKYGADPNAKGKMGFTALHHATSFENTPSKVVSELIKLGADVNAKTATLDTPLQLALSKNASVVEELIKNGAILETAEKDKTILHVAVSKGKPKALEAVLLATKDFEGGKFIQKVSADGRTLVHFAAAVQGTGAEMIKLLVKYGVDPKATSLKGDTPLHFASNAAAVKTLLELGVDINAQNSEVCLSYLS